MSLCPIPSKGWSSAAGNALLSFSNAFFMFGSLAPCQMTTFAFGSFTPALFSKLNQLRILGLYEGHAFRP